MVSVIKCRNCQEPELLRFILNLLQSRVCTVSGFFGMDLSGTGFQDIARYLQILKF